ncbi:MAG: ABC transporter ATP-binding protein/permease [Muribaculaceae bacterium]|nr:ABC transporter ATP-binding protein/permease [Muribaculaceae bacterium]
MIRYIYGLTKGFRGRIVLSASAGIVRVATGLIFVAMSKKAVDIATGSSSGNLTFCVIGLISALIVELICSAISNRTIDLSETKIKNNLQEKLFSRLMMASWYGQEKYHSGDLISRLTEDCRVASECLCRTVPTIIISLFQLIGTFLFLWYFSPLLAITLLLLLPVFLLAGKAFFMKMRLLTRRIRGIESRLQEKMQESLHHRILLLTYRHTYRTLKAISSLHNARYSTMRKRIDITTYSRTAIIAGFETGYLAAFLWGIMGLYKGTVTFGMMTAYLQLAGQIQRPLAELARLLPGLIHSHTAFARILEIERIPIENESSKDDTFMDQQAVGISFNNVSFAYPGNPHPILYQFNHIFSPGSKTAIMGETGAGKSTLLRLILALLKQDEGEIEMFTESGNKENIIPVSAATRSRMVYVPQGNSLLSGTIRQNLQIAKPEASEEEMKEALHAAAADFVYKLKFGLETKCGENGSGLSEGQAQRIAIARGLLKPGSILLLDEISASLDEDTEKILMQRLSDKAKSHTILIVTHRSAILPYCDDIIRI